MIGLLPEDDRLLKRDQGAVFYGEQKNTATIAAQTQKREDMVPTAVNATIYFNPHTLTVNATRTITSSTTNRIDFTATLK